MRVLHLIASLGGGGAERQLSYLARACRAQGTDCSVLALSGGVNLGQLLESGVEVQIRPDWHHRDPRLVPRLVREIRKIKPDIIQTWLPAMDVAGGGAASILGVPWILSERASELCYTPPGVALRVRRFIGARATAIVCNSEMGREYWSKLHQQSNVRVIRNGLPIDEIDRAAGGAWWPLDTSNATLLAVGRLVDQKNVARLIRAFAVVACEFPAASLQMFGDGPLLAECRQIISSERIGARVTIQPYVQDIWSRMRQADAVVSVSHFEGHPNAVLEAAAIGTPLVLSDIREHREIFSDNDVTYCSANDIESIAQALRRVLSGDVDLNTRASRARRIARQFTVDVMTQSYGVVYRELTSKAVGA